jgi:diaminohydroxyphosphoribosylaminopyrimidine deaminase/5-amino-6-(5-phosphoribosylamino)uracil reductase
MALALEQARLGFGRTAPNPAVGCVLVRDGQAVGRGWHRRAGLPHAEVEALRDAGAAARGATAYVTLEPCSHHGRTPPCADALIEAGVARVVAGLRDPNPQVAGRGISRLRRAGIEVRVGVGRSDCLDAIRGFASLVTRARPWVELKLAASLDGRLAARGGASQWITNADSRRLVHEMRARADAILVGS